MAVPAWQVAALPAWRLQGLTPSCSCKWADLYSAGGALPH